MAIELKVDLKKNGIDELFNALSYLDHRALTGARSQIGEAIHSMSMDAFEEEKTPEGDVWKKSQRAEKEGGQTLTDMAILRNSISVAVSDDEVSVGTNMVYGAIQLLGGEAGRNKSVTIDARAYLPDPGGELLPDVCLDVVQEHIKRAVA